jgi:hypothetical protein
VSVQIPAEFVQPDEFYGMTRSRQRAAWRRWLDRIGVRYVPTPFGYPLVYRDRLTPEPQAESTGAAVLNLEALRGTRRQTARSA